MELNDAFALALKELRARAKRTQYDFTTVSREYISLLERGQRSPSLDKIDEISRSIDIHPLSLLAQCYLHKDPELELSDLVRLISSELAGDLKKR